MKLQIVGLNRDEEGLGGDVMADGSLYLGKVRFKANAAGEYRIRVRTAFGFKYEWRGEIEDESVLIRRVYEVVSDALQAERKAEFH